MTTLIALAVESLRTEAMDRAEAKAKEVLMNISELLDANGFDRNAFAPFPGSNLSREKWATIKSYHDLVRRCTKTNWPGASRSMKDPDIGKMDFDVSSKFIKEAREDASLQYDAYVAKLESKIGEVTEANLVGNHVWSYSILNVTKSDGSVEKWKTQMIVNVSKLGKIFNQFPTRKVK